MVADLLLVYSSPKSPEREAEYNQWYNQFHLRQMLKVHGIVGVTRYILSRVQTEWYPPMKDHPEWPYGTHPYLAIYEIDRQVGIDAVLDGIRSTEDLRHSADPDEDPVTWGEQWFYEMYAQRERPFSLDVASLPPADDDHPRALWLVPTTPLSPEGENEYHKWYNLQAVLANDGFEAVARYRLSRTQGRIDSRAPEPEGEWPHGQHHYLALWDVSDVYRAWSSRRRGREAMLAREGGSRPRYPWMADWPSLHHADAHIFYEPITRRVPSPWNGLRGA